MRRRPALLALLALVGALTVFSTRRRPATAQAPAPRAPFTHVLIVSFDGMRDDAVDAAQPPHILALARRGARALAASTIDNSSTLPSHSSMLSGTESAAHAMHFDDFRPERGFIRVPTVFTIAHDAGFATAMFVSKTKLRHIAVPGSLDVWSLPHWSCERVSAAAAVYLQTAPAGITFVHFSEPDDAGHMHRWMGPQYLRAIVRADACLGTMLEALDARTDGARALVIVSADHGGHGRRHGTVDPVDLHIPWVAAGPGVASQQITRPVRTLDTAATALGALGLAHPAWMTGQPVVEVLAPTP